MKKIDIEQGLQIANTLNNISIASTEFLIENLVEDSYGSIDLNNKVWLEIKKRLRAYEVLTKGK